MITVALGEVGIPKKAKRSVASDPYGNLPRKALIGMISGKRSFQLPKQFDRDLRLKDPLKGKGGIHFLVRNCKHSIMRGQCFLIEKFGKPVILVGEARFPIKFSFCP